MALKDIKNFLAEINTGGILKSNKYLAEIHFPPEHYLNRRAVGDSEMTRRLALRCDSVTLPGINFATIEAGPRMGYGPMVRMPYNITTDEMTMTFIVDSNSHVHKTFYDWSNSIVNFQGKGARSVRNANMRLMNGLNHKAYEVGYHDQYRVDIEISIYQTGGGGVSVPSQFGSPEFFTGTDVNSALGASIKKAMKIHVYDAVPLSFPQVQMNWEDHQPIKLTIPFTYTDFSIEYLPKE